MNKINGFLCGLTSSATFGLIPLFTLPIMKCGMGFESILTYRFLLAALALGIILLIRKQSFRIRPQAIPALIILAMLYLIGALFLFWGYQLMSSGVATTIHFMYPVLTTLIMMFFFHERRSGWRITAIILAVLGVFFLSRGGSAHISSFGLIIVLISALGYAVYLVTISQLKVIQMKGLPLTFYIFLFSGLLLLAGVSISDRLQPITDWHIAGNLLFLALIPTIISNLTLVRSIQSIGSTLTSVLGAMEPVTAVCIGIVIFGEPMTAWIAIGISLIIGAVTLIILKR